MKKQLISRIPKIYLVEDCYELSGVHIHYASPFGTVTSKFYYWYFKNLTKPDNYYEGLTLYPIVKITKTIDKGIFTVSYNNHSYVVKGFKSAIQKSIDLTNNIDTSVKVSYDSCRTQEKRE